MWRRIKAYIRFRFSRPFVCRWRFRCSVCSCPYRVGGVS